MIDNVLPGHGVQVGTTDRRLNEVITEVAQIDTDAVEEKVRKKKLWYILFTLFAVIASGVIFFPIIAIFICFNYTREAKEIRLATQNQVYCTKSSFVFVNATLPIEQGVTIFPLANIATLFGDGNVLTINIKPTAPEVIMNIKQPTRGGYQLTTSFASRSIRIEGIKNASEFCAALQGQIEIA